MKVIFLKEFSKDLDGIPLKSVKLSLKRVIERMETTDALTQIRQTLVETVDIINKSGS